MLRWCLSTVRTLGGRSNVIHDIRALRSRPVSGHVIPQDNNYQSSPVPDATTHVNHPNIASNACGQETQSIGSVIALPTSIDDVGAPKEQFVWRHNRPDALTVLRTFLSRCNMHSPIPRKHTANTLKSLYTTVKSRGQLSQLGSGRIGTLISLLGTLSLPKPRNRCVFSNDFALHMEGQVTRSHWPFILMAVRDKERLNQRLTQSDRYWAMRAELANAHSISKANSQSRERALNRARIHYLHFHQKIEDPEIRFPYLQSLLALCPKRAAEVADRLCDLLRWHDNGHPRLVALLWKLVLKHSVDIPTRLKAKLLSTLHGRLTVFQQMTLENSRRLLPCKSGREKGIESVNFPLNIVDFATTLTSVVFCRTSVSPQHPTHCWAINQGLSTFSLDAPLDIQWNHLVLMAIFNSQLKSGNDTPGIIPDLPSPEARDCSTDWRTVFSLATLEKSLGFETALPKRQAQVIDGVRKVIGDLWRAWSLAAKRQPHPPPVSRAILVSFLRISGIVIDVSLKDACFRFCSSHHLWQIDSLDDREISQVKHLMVEYMFASVLCGQRNWAVLFSSLDQLLPQWRSEVVVKLISRFADHSVDVAYQLFVFCRPHQDIPRATVLSLGLSLASQNLLDFAIPFLQDPRLSQTQVQELTDAVLRTLMQNRIRFLDLELTAILADAIQRTYESLLPSLTLRNPIQHVLILIASSNHPLKAVTIFQCVNRPSPTYFTPSFNMLFLGQLVKQRQFRLAVRLLVHLASSHPDQIGNLRRTVVVGLAKAGASTLARRVASMTVHDQYVRSRIELSIRALEFRMRSPSRALSLKAVPILTRHPLDGSSIRLALQILVHARRPLAAKKLFERVRGELDTKTQTALGNIILHGTLLRPSLRNGRQMMRKVLATLDFLVKKQDFIPDRITANIMLKAILRWSNAIDCHRLRAIFDQMVNIGYSPRDQLLGGEVPFGTLVTRRPGDTQRPKLHDAMSFEKHVRPMYKMFIKAFYLRGDIHAAKTVVGYLKAAQREARSSIKGGST